MRLSFRKQVRIAPHVFVNVSKGVSTDAVVGAVKANAAQTSPLRLFVTLLIAMLLGCYLLTR